MREIKFRAWDNRNKRFTKQFYVSADGKPYTYWDDPLPNALDIVLMQYTGLKDKNGVEIYEGDILRAWCDFYDNGLTETVVPVVWIDDLAIFTLGGWGDRSLAAFADKEVIGNIYENPELLK